MAIVSDVTLKSFFENGDKPTAAQFAALIDSMVNKIDDYELLGLHKYDENRLYKQGDTVVHNNVIYICIAIETTGTFTTVDWDSVAGEMQLSADGASEEVESNNTTTLSTKLTVSITPPEQGDYKIEWYFELGSQTADSILEGQVKTGGTTLGSSTITAKEVSPDSFYSFSGFKKETLTAASHDITIEYRKKTSGSGACEIRRARITITKI